MMLHAPVIGPRIATAQPDAGARTQRARPVSAPGNQALLRGRPEPLRPSRTPLLQRECAACKDEREDTSLQAKLTVNEPGDEYEQEADRVADQVMRMPDPMVQRLQCGGSDASATDRSGAPPKRILRLANAGSSAAEVASDFVARLGTGTPLDSASRGYFEPRFGHQFGDVRIHTGPQADSAAASVQARAFTLGRDVVFAAGEHDPGSDRGKRLLAHELTHVVQQVKRPRGIQRTISVKDPTAITPPQTTSNSAVVVGLVNQLCPDTTWQSSGSEIVPATADFCADAATRKTTMRTSCDCLCRFVSKAGPHASIAIDPTHDDTQFSQASGAKDSFDIRLRGVAATGIQGVTGAPVVAGATSPRMLSDPPWLILGHELCGHAMTTLPNVSAAGRASSVSHESTAAWDQSAVDIENRIRREHSTGSIDLGTRAGDFTDTEGIHYGAIVKLPNAMKLADLLTALEVPAGSHKPRCPVPSWYELCGSTAAIGSIAMLDRVVYRSNGSLGLASSCLTHTFAAGDFFAIEGVFWHLADGGLTKTEIASRWGVTVVALDQANKLFAPAVAALAATDVVAANSSVTIPYRSAAGATRFFFKPFAQTGCED